MKETKKMSKKKLTHERACVIGGSSGKLPSFTTLAKDITERKQMDEKLRRQEKLAVMGQLAGGVGHELRNPLGVIKNAVYFLNRVLEEPEPEVKETLEILDKEVDNSERIIRNLLDFARARPPSWRKVDVNDARARSVKFKPSLVEFARSRAKNSH